jgi:hypothetical protein
MIMELEKIYIVLRHEVWAYKPWHGMKWGLQLTRNGNLQGTSPKECDCKLSLARGKPHTIHYLRTSPIQFTSSGTAPYRKTGISKYSIIFRSMSSFARRINMHKSLNGKELMYISIGWLHDLNAIVFQLRVYVHANALMCM